MVCRCPLGRPSADACPQCTGRDLLKNAIRIEPLEKPKPKNRPAVVDRQTKTLLPCIHRGELAGKVNCGCQGAKEVYRCNRLIRPSSTLDPAFCVAYDLVKYVGIALKDGGRLSKDEVPKSEIVVCQPGKCDLYQPAVR